VLCGCDRVWVCVGGVWVCCVGVMECMHVCVCAKEYKVDGRVHMYTNTEAQERTASWKVCTTF